jgi:hypothetical protein
MMYFANIFTSDIPYQCIYRTLSVLVGLYHVMYYHISIFNVLYNLYGLYQDQQSNREDAHHIQD